MSEQSFYRRQTILKSVGLRGQEKLKNSKAVIIGAGGLGHPVAIYLASAGIGSLRIIDFDKIEMSNLNRQICFKTTDVGGYKAKILSERIKKQNPFIEVNSFLEKVTTNNILELIQGHDIVLDCTDNHGTTFLLHDYCWKLGIDLVQASLYQYEGQIQRFVFSKNKERGCLRCLWETMPETGSGGNCEESGVIGAIAGNIGTLQAFEAIKMLLSLGSELVNTTAIINLLSLEIQKIKWKKKSNCSLCSSEKTLKEIESRHNEVAAYYELISPDYQKYSLIDIREKHEFSENDFFHVERVKNLPLSESGRWLSKLDSSQKYLFICARGIRSASLVKKLRKSKSLNCYSLRGGIGDV